MISNHYFNLSLDQQTFSITHSLRKPKKRHNSIATLEKIERVLRKDYQYLPTFSADHPLHQMTKRAVILFLQNKAEEIRNGYVQKQSKLCWLWRKIFSKKKQVDAIYKKIANFTPLTQNALPVIADCIPTILENLPINDLLSFTQVNAHAKIHADLALKSAACKLGCKDKNISPAKKYLKDLHVNLQFLSKQDWKYGPNKKAFIRNLIKRDHRGKISIEESLKRLRLLPIDDLARLFIYDAPIAHLRKAILTPQISTGGEFKDKNMANLALYLAVKEEEVEVVQFLLFHGANASLGFCDFVGLMGTNNENILLPLSIEQKTPYITHLLLQAGATIPVGLLHKAVGIPNNQANIKLLLQHGADINQLDDRAESAIFVAIKNNDFTNVQTLIESGIDLNYTNRIGQTVLHQAVVFGSRKIIELLVKHGASPNLVDGSGLTPLDLLFLR